MNFFELFRLPEQFEVDQARLTEAYRTLVKLTHPDRFATASQQDRLLAVQKNAQVNDGFQVLKHPLSRAEHMLTLRGVDLQHEQQTMQDTLFLMQQMEWREQLSEISTSEQQNELDELDTEIKRQIEIHLSDVANLLGKNTSESNLKAAHEVRKLKFLYKLRREIASKDEQLADF